MRDLWKIVFVCAMAWKTLSYLRDGVKKVRDYVKMEKMIRLYNE